MALVQTGRPSMDRGSHLWRTFVRAACGLAVIVAATTAHAQQPIPQGAPPPSATPPGTLPPGFPDNPPAGMAIDPAPQFVMPSPDAFHAVFRLHQTIADSVGDNGELTTLGGFFPHALDDGLWYFDGQFDILEDPSLASEQTLNFAANLGFGRRWLDAFEGQTFGLSAWYDVLNIGQQYNHQVSVGAELLGDVWDWRTNGYFPIGTARNTIGAPPGADIRAGVYRGGHGIRPAAARMAGRERCVALRRWVLLPGRPTADRNWRRDAAGSHRFRRAEARCAHDQRCVVQNQRLVRHHLHAAGRGPMQATRRQPRRLGALWRPDGAGGARNRTVVRALQTTF